jgi:hypothetical protein
VIPTASLGEEPRSRRRRRFKEEESITSPRFVARAFENAKDLSEEVPSVTTTDIAGPASRVLPPSVSHRPSESCTQD